MDASPHSSSLSAPLPYWPTTCPLSLAALDVPLSGRRAPPLTCKWVMLRSMFMVDVSQFSEMYL